jgi:peptide chain release factor 1
VACERAERLGERLGATQRAIATSSRAAGAHFELARDGGAALIATGAMALRTAARRALAAAAARWAGAAAAAPAAPAGAAAAAARAALPFAVHLAPPWRRAFAAAPAAAPPAAEGGDAALTPALEARVAAIGARHAALVARLGAPSAAALGHAELARANKEAAELAPVVAAAGALAAARAELADLAALAAAAAEPAELRALAAGERAALAAGPAAAARAALLAALLPRDAADARGAVLEVRAGAGGAEAALFAADLFRMYERYATARGWRFEVAEYAPGELGGCRLASATVSGRGGAYGRLRFESGVHRVQRVPATETAGRVHTSAASVAVLPEPAPDDGAAAIRDEDLRIDVYRSGGAGGQHVNTTNSAVRVTHLPSGLAVCIQDERSQHRNKAKALKVLGARLADAAARAAGAALSAERKGLVGSGDRSERVRTYNFAAGRVTDHRVGVTEHALEAVLAGERLDGFVDALRRKWQAESLATLGAGGDAPA